jgi:hypothetical protein
VTFGLSPDLSILLLAAFVRPRDSDTTQRIHVLYHGSLHFVISECVNGTSKERGHE